MKKWTCISFLLSILLSCTSTNSKETAIAKITVATKFVKFHDALFASESSLKELKQTYPYMFPAAMPDSLVIERKKDTVQQFLYQQVKKVYPNFNQQEEELTAMFQHIKYYFPKYKIPTVVTDITGVSYQDRVLYANHLLLISLDMFLGSTNEIYSGFPTYLTQTFNAEHLTSQVAKKIIEKQYPFTKDRTFLGQLIFEGKKLYLEQLYLPKNLEVISLGYTSEKMQWAQNNEAAIWSYFIKNELLYSNNPKLKQRFIDLAPFSKFYLTIDQQTPGRIANYIGWQIVKAYAQKHQPTLKDLMELDAQTILSASGFKPKK